MKKLLIILLNCIVGTLYAQSIQSPSKEINVLFAISENGKPSYSIFYKNKPIIKESFLGIKLKEGGDLTSGFSIVGSHSSSFDEVWHPVVGEQTAIKNHYNEMIFELNQDNTSKKITIVFIIKVFFIFTIYLI